MQSAPVKSDFPVTRYSVMGRWKVGIKKCAIAYIPAPNVTTAQIRTHQAKMAFMKFNRDRLAGFQAQPAWAFREFRLARKNLQAIIPNMGGVGRILTLPPIHTHDLAANRSHDGLSPSPPLINGGEGRGEVVLSFLAYRGSVRIRPEVFRWHSWLRPAWPAGLWPFMEK